MQRYISAFKGFDNTIEIANWKEFDVQELLKESALLITDYSSVYFDMIYRKNQLFSTSLTKINTGNINIKRDGLIITIMTLGNPFQKKAML